MRQRGHHVDNFAVRGEQDQDNPQHYSNSTCGVHIIPEADDATGLPPAKRLKKSSSGRADPHMERRHSGGQATTSGQAPGRPIGQSLTNPIDHIFQFHKVRHVAPGQITGICRAGPQLYIENAIATDWERSMLSAG